MEDLTRYPGLASRGKRGTFWFRTTVPAELRPVVGRREITKSLRTADLSKALAAYHDTAAQAERTLGAARASLRGEAVTAAPTPAKSGKAVAVASTLDAEYDHRANVTALALADPTAFHRGELVALPDDLDRLPDGRETPSYWAAVMDEAPLKERLAYVFDWHLSRRIDALQVDLAVADFANFLPAADGDRAQARRLMQAELGTLKSLITTAPAPVVPAQVPALATAPIATAPKLTDAQDPAFEVAVTKWVAEKTAAKAWKTKTLDERLASLAQFTESASTAGRRLSSFTDEDATTFKSVLMDLPTNRKQRAKLRNLNIHDAAKEARRLDLPRLSVVSVNQELRVVGEFFKWCRRNYKKAVVADLFDGLTIKKKTKARDERDPFTTAELVTLFNSAVYKGANVSRDDPLFWVPLLALFTGMRSNEICRLRGSDIQREDGINFINITDAKTDAGTRRVPIHAFLVSAGFIAFAAPRSGRLFPTLKEDKYGAFSDDFGKIFRKQLKALGVKRLKNCFHSFRHNVEDALADSGIDSGLINYLQGHGQEGQRGRYGSNRLALSILAPEMAKLNYRGLDLSHLQTTPKS